MQRAIRDHPTLLYLAKILLPFLGSDYFGCERTDADCKPGLPGRAKAYQCGGDVAGEIRELAGVAVAKRMIGAAQLEHAA